MREGLRVPLAGLGGNRRPDIVRPNVRVRCTKCVLILRTKRACRVIQGAPRMRIVTTKALLVSQWIGWLCEGMLVSLHGQAIYSMTGTSDYAEDS